MTLLRDWGLGREAGEEEQEGEEEEGRKVV